MFAIGFVLFVICGILSSAMAASVDEEGSAGYGLVNGFVMLGCAMMFGSLVKSFWMWLP